MLSSFSFLHFQIGSRKSCPFLLCSARPFGQYVFEGQSRGPAQGPQFLSDLCALLWCRGRRTLRQGPHGARGWEGFHCCAHSTDRQRARHTHVATNSNPLPTCPLLPSLSLVLLLSTPVCLYGSPPVSRIPRPPTTQLPHRFSSALRRIYVERHARTTPHHVSTAVRAGRGKSERAQ